MGADLEDLLNAMRQTNILLSRIADKDSGKARADKAPGEKVTEEEKEKAKDEKKAEAQQQRKAAKLRQTRVNIGKDAAVGLTDPFKPRGLVAIETAQAGFSATPLGTQGAAALANLSGVTAEAFTQKKTGQDLSGILAGLGEAGISVDKGFAKELTEQLETKNKIIEENLKLGKQAQDDVFGVGDTAGNVAGRMLEASTKLLEAAVLFKGVGSSGGKKTTSTDPTGGG